jgi:sugar phosphate isomerase/epimerase
LKAAPHFDLLNDAPLRRSVRSLCEATGVGVVNTSSIWLDAKSNCADQRLLIERSADLQARNIVLLCDDSDAARRTDAFMGVCEEAASAGLGVAIEHVPFSSIKTVQDAAAMIRAARREHFGRRAGLLADVLHLYRSGGKMEDYRQVNAEWFLHAQICDGPLAFDSDPKALLDEARFERAVPGEGQFDLAAFIRALPDGLPVGIEVPQRALAAQGVSAQERARRIVDATRTLIQSVH